MYQHHSAKIQPGDTFLCLPGGEKYIEAAKKNGATKIEYVTRKDLAQIANTHFSNPSKDLTVIGITGTNGKTTVAHIVGQILEKTGHTPYVQGTINAPLTTPESFDTLKKMAEHKAKGGSHFVMEVSSHAIDQDRIHGIDFDIKCLTNISQDHLDYHHTIEAYSAVKMAFMDAPAKTHIYEADYQKESLPKHTNLKGDFNQNNLKAAKAILEACNIDSAQIDKHLKTVTAPPGRFEAIEEGQNYLVIVDYAHTHDALENILKEAQKIAQEKSGNITTIFGCGGERDRDKRPKMAQVAQHYSQHVILTLDNPRNEAISQINDDIIKGFSKTAHYTVINDRQTAIETAIADAKKNDIIIIAGKGHETKQFLSTGPIDFDDRAIARSAIRKQR